MDSVCLHHPKVTFPAHTHTFRLPLLNPLYTCKVHEQLARTCGTFPQWQLAVVPVVADHCRWQLFLLLLMTMMLLPVIGVVATD